MAKIIGVTNQKGGVGKSSTALALGAYLGVQARKKVLIIDLDPQGNLSHTLRLNPGAAAVWDVLAGNKSIPEAVQKTPYGDCLCSSPMLTGADRSLDRTGKEYILKEALGMVTGNYEYVIIDTAPALGILTVNALAACDEVVIPSQADIYSLQGIGQLYLTIEAVRKYCNPALSIAGILITRFKERIILNREIAGVLEQTAAGLRTRVFTSRIRENIAVKEAQARRTDLFSYAPGCNATLDYAEFIREYLGIPDPAVGIGRAASSLLFPGEVING
jgi:chromosome partitioning protein